MVLFKRKPVRLQPAPTFISEDTEVWGIEATGEVFTDYEKFLERRDYYSQRAFTCQTTGRQGLTYFEAKESETEASVEVNKTFPKGLREPVLRYVQFQTHPRMDDLVNDVFDVFKEHFTVGDRIYYDDSNVRRFGIITEVTHQNNGQTLDDSNRALVYTILLDTGEKVTRYRASELVRDRETYSKIIVKQFLRQAVVRESWLGAPWKVKDSLAKSYEISTKVPDHKTREAVLAHRRAVQNGQVNGTSPPRQQAYVQSNGHAPHTNGHRPQLPPPGRPGYVNFSASGPLPYVSTAPVPHHFAPINHGPYLLSYPHVWQNGPLPQAGPPGLPGPHGGPAPMYAYAHPNSPPLPQLAHMLQQAPVPPNGGFAVSFQHPPNPRAAIPPQPQQVIQPLARPFEPIKYPCEDLDIRAPRTVCKRPALKFFSDDVPEGIDPPAEDKKTGVLMKSMGPLLCAWDTLNIHDSIYQLDSFTFDDFVDAMRFSDPETECELLVEIHCSVLKQVVDHKGAIMVNLPLIAETASSDAEDSSEEPSPVTSPEPEPQPTKRRTRASAAKDLEVQSVVVKARTPTPEPPKELHKAVEFVAGFEWQAQCAERNFIEGGWEAIVVAVLYRLSFDPAQKDACDEILAQLVPPEDEEPSFESIAERYQDLDVNLRISALDMILRLTIATEAFRDQLAAAMSDMTGLRKEKIEYQRKRKELADELATLDLDRRIALPLNTPDSPSETKDTEDGDVTMTSVTDDTVEINGKDEATPGKTKRLTTKERKAMQAKARAEKAEKAKAEAERKQKQKAWEKLLADIQKKKDELLACEAQIAELDDDLRETSVNRSKLLGKDRFLNKYYWFEHNGMPFGGVPNSSTAHYGYANGRIWVQGPDELELQPCLEEPALTQDKERFGFTIAQRKEQEEGSTHLSKASEWAYYDDPEDVNQLLKWLDERGSREKLLRKELQLYFSHIIEYMNKMRKHLAEADKQEEEEPESATRVSTRNKTYADKEAVKDRCLLWKNSIMREDNGYSHYEEYQPKKKGGKAKATKGNARGKAKR